MKIYTKTVWDSETLRILSTESYDCSGTVGLACGASGQQESALANEQKISGLLTQNFQQFAGENQNILQNLTSTLTPISQAGPSQFGLTPQAEAAERASAAENLNAAGANAANSVRSTLASRGGGTTYLPSGSEASIIGSLAQNTAVQDALAQSQITQQGYQLGRENWLAATQGLATAPGELENPITGAGNAAMGAAGQEMQGANDITQANQAWMAPVGGIIGSVGGAAVGNLTKPKGGGSAGGGPTS